MLKGYLPQNNGKDVIETICQRMTDDRDGDPQQLAGNKEPRYYAQPGNIGFIDIRITLADVAGIAAGLSKPHKKDNDTCQEQTDDIKIDNYVVVLDIIGHKEGDIGRQHTGNLTERRPIGTNQFIDETGITNERCTVN